MPRDGAAGNNGTGRQALPRRRALSAEGTADGAPVGAAAAHGHIPDTRSRRVANNSCKSNLHWVMAGAIAGGRAGRVPFRGSPNCGHSPDDACRRNPLAAAEGVMYAFSAHTGLLKASDMAFPEFPVLQPTGTAR
jgi:hypothetical protein